MLRCLLPFLFAGVMPMNALAACDLPEYRQFDFWIGDWEVVGGAGSAAEGQLQGHNRIEKVSAGCALAEHWRGAKGLEGHSLNTWDPNAKRWRHFWVGGDGAVLQLEGGLRDGVMELVGELATAGGGMQQQRIRWTPHADGGVTQQWDTSDDAGKTWSTSFLGLYRPRSDR